MKNKLSFIALLSCALFSCAKEIPSDNINSESGAVLTISAALEGDGKTILNDLNKVYWLKDFDTLTVFDADGVSAKCVLTDGSDRKQSGLFIAGSWTGGTPLYVSCSSGAKPSDCVPSYADGLLTVRLNTAQSIYDYGSFGRNAFVSVGKIAGEGPAYQIDGAMKNVAGLIQFSILGTEVCQVKIEAVGEEAVAGNVQVDYAKLANGDKDFWTAVPGRTQSYVTLEPCGVSAASDGCFVPGAYCVALLPQTYSQGIKISLFDKSMALIGEKTVGATGFEITRNVKSKLNTPIDDTLPDNITLDVFFGGAWPFNEAIVPAASRKISGDQYTFRYNYGEGLHKDFEFTICKRLADKTYYQSPSTGAYKGTGINALFMQADLGWISLPKISGRKIASIEYSITNGGAKMFRVKDDLAATTSITAKSVPAATASAPSTVTVDNDGKGYGSQQIYAVLAAASQTYRLKINYVKDTDPQPLPGTFSNPLTQASVPDPTVYEGGDGYYYLYYTGKLDNNLYRSKDLVTWENSGICPISATTNAQLKVIADAHESDYLFYAPTVKKIGDNFLMYTSLTYKAMVVLKSTSPTGPFEFDGDPYVLIDNDITGLADVTNEDSCVATDLDGTNYLMWGSHGRMMRTTLTADGLHLAPGAVFDHVAGDPLHPRQLFEGLNAYWREGYWYLFAAKGNYTSATDPYEVVVGRCETLGGRFVDKEGRYMDEGYATLILSPDSCETYLGGAHTGEIYVDKAGRSYIFYQRQLATKEHYRPLFLQQIFWADDGWPYFKNGVTQMTDIKPQL